MGGPKRFDELAGVSAPTLAVLARLGFTRATPVQEATIPLFSGHKDVAVDACTGSGKTLAFVIPVVEKIRQLEERLRPNQVGAMIVSPTRELARQIHNVALPFVETLPGARAMLLVGGSDPAEDVAALVAHGATVLVGTPGRLADVVARTRGNAATLDLRRLEVLVLDEADRLLDMGFQPQLDALMAALPRQRRTGLFSATQTEAVQALARAGLRNPVRINVAVAGAPSAGGKGGDGGGGGQKTPSELSIRYLVCDTEQKLPYLVRFLKEHKESKVIVYFLTCACVDFFVTALERLPVAKGLAVTSLHGRMKQAAREAALAAFADAPAGALFCTDVAARGLDIPDVHWIVQHDAPQDPAAFVHRVGRTARMGRAGSALALLAPHETAYVEFLRLRRVPLAEQEAAATLRELPDLAADVRALAEADRDVMEKGTRAFVSWVRGYKEHQCRFIFRLGDVDLGRLGHVFGLLRMPRMAEIKHAAVALKHFRPSPIDPNTVKFLDKAREKQRQKSLKQAAGTAASQPAAPARQPGKAAKRPPEQEARLPAAKRRLLDGRQDAAELADEYALLRKLKKGKLSEHEFDLATGLAEDEPLAEGKGRHAHSGGPKGSGPRLGAKSNLAPAAAKQKKARRKR